MTSDKRTCNGTNAQDKPCEAPPLKPGTVIEGVAAQVATTADSTTWICLIRPELEGQRLVPGASPSRVSWTSSANASRRSGEVCDALWAALHAERALVVGNGPTAHLELVPDHPTRIAAARELLDRAYGRTRQASEVVVITEEMIDEAIVGMEAEIAELEGAGERA
jgi:hypothetical protein